MQPLAVGQAEAVDVRENSFMRSGSARLKLDEVQQGRLEPDNHGAWRVPHQCKRLCKPERNIHDVQRQAIREREHAFAQELRVTQGPIENR